MQSTIIYLDSSFKQPYTLNTGNDTAGNPFNMLDISKYINKSIHLNYQAGITPDINPFIYRDMLTYLNKCADIVSYIPSNSYYQEALTDSIRNSYTYLFHYANSIWSETGSTTNNNQYLIRYEDIRGISNTSYINLSSETNITDFINALDETNYNSDISNINFYNGGFLYPDIKSINNLLTEGGERDSLLIKPGESVSVPVTFEYYINNTDGNNQDKISKSIIFAIKDSLSEGPKYYEIEITGNINVQELNTIFSNIDNFTLTDSITIND